MSGSKSPWPFTNRRVFIFFQEWWQRGQITVSIITNETVSAKWRALLIIRRFLKGAVTSTRGRGPSSAPSVARNTAGYGIWRIIWRSSVARSRKSAAPIVHIAPNTEVACRNTLSEFISAKSREYIYIFFLSSLSLLQHWISSRQRSICTSY